jgi:hypothetical protein
VCHTAIFHRRPNLSTSVLHIGRAHQFSFMAGNQLSRSRNEAEHELSGPKERAPGAAEIVLDNSLFIRLVSLRLNLTFRMGGNHDHWTNDAW